MSDGSHIHPSHPQPFNVTEPVSRSRVRREVIRLFRASELSPREILEQLMEQFYGVPVSEQDRRAFLWHATVLVREEALIRGAAAATKPNIYSELLDAFRYLDQADPGAAHILELAYVAEIGAADIANMLNVEPEAVAKKLQGVQSWLRRVAAGEPLSCYEIEPARPTPRGEGPSRPLPKRL